MKKDNQEILRLRSRIEDLEKSEKRLKQSEYELHDSRKQYRTLVETLHEGLVIADPEENIVFANEAFSVICQYSRSEIIEMNWKDILPEKELQKLLNETAKRKKGISSLYEINLRRKDNELRRVSISAVPCLNRDGEFESSIALILDITERKKAEDILRNSEEKYRTLTENINIGVYRNTVGPKGKFIEANPAIIKMFGYKNKEKFLSINVSDLYENSEDRRIFNSRMLSFGYVRDEELRLRRKNGTVFFGSVSAVAVKDEQGRIRYYDGVIEDITERKRSDEIKRNFKDLRRTLEGTVHALAVTAEITDPYTAGHQYRVSSLACAIARKLGLPEKQIEGIRIAGILHDIGKIYVPPSILNRPGKLVEIEFSMIRAHPSVGYNILKSIDFPWPIAEAVLQHHERLDGSGYPKGLKSEGIILEARILGVADVVEAMSSHRPYRPAIGRDISINEISQNKGILFDADVVDACIKVLVEDGFEFEST
ncbi:MAG: PAS domain S-box protein [Candidatus Aegiribacteria sp.]|nr:PAS domain S-box protein [Candidatus Aegiribacteria sp.]